MAANSRSLSPTRSDDKDDVETLQTLAIFCGVGLLLSLLPQLTAGYERRN
jgi:hypothetical protein